jgi:bis(5'-nucleosidyl)-tetraphosphatase
MPQDYSVGIVIFHGNKYLLLQYRRGHWGLAKGKPHTGEKREEAARREVKEETGIEGVFLVKDFMESEEYFFRRAGKVVHKKVDYFLGESPTKDVTISEEHIDFKWLGFHESMAEISFPETRNVLKLANDKRKLHG